METPTDRSSFLGTGWSFPPLFTANGADVEMVSREEDIFQSLQILLSTNLNERSMQLSYGSDMNIFLFEEIDQSLITNIYSLISDAIYYHEPRITLDNVEVNADEQESGLLLISVKYTIKATNSRYNLVWPFYINEAVQTLI
ncbi:MAG: GPW/gp25 family protein [Bacteroidia bacterium]|nr:GPW/gp25 family protein [Bacteroidia bacterium]